MEHWHIRHTLLIKERPDALDKAYRREVRWPQGFRVNLDSRLILLGLRRFIECGVFSEPVLRNSDYVLGCRLGSMDSYERFDISLASTTPAPLAFAYALPSIPLACASVCHGLRGQTYTLVGQADVGVRALHQAVVLLLAGRSRRVIFGCWESPSATSGHGPNKDHCRLLLGMVEAANNTTRAVLPPLMSSAMVDGLNDDCVAALASSLQTLTLPGASTVTGHD